MLSLEPDASTAIFKTTWHIFFKPIFIKMFHIGIEHNNSKAAVEREKSPKQIHFVPAAFFIDHPGFGIFEWMKDIVKVYDNTFLKIGKDLEEDLINIASCFRNVT